MEQGILATSRRMNFVLKFEAFPIWLLSLDPGMVDRISIMGAKSHREFQLQMNLLQLSTGLADAMLDNISRSRIDYVGSSSPPGNATLLVSGSLAFVKSWNLQVTNPVLVLCDEHVRCKRVRFAGNLRWSQLRHETFGGVTHFQTMLGTNIPNFEPSRTSLRRTIRHVLDYSLKPRWAHPPGPQDQSLTLNERLHPGDLQRQICYHTHYSATGWGTRRLSLDEVGIAFGWPAWARNANQNEAAFPCVPLQIMDGCLKSLSSSIPRATPLRTPAPPAAVLSCDRSWLPTIQKFLPHSWIDSTLVTAKAAKRDDAGVPAHLWDQRCSLVLPHCTPAIPILRSLLARKLVTRMWDEFGAYLVVEHGANWRVALSSHKERLKKEGRFRKSGKRSVGDREEETNSSHPSQELAKDVAAGVDVLSRFDGANWWAWKKGSSLVFWRWPAGEQRLSARDGMPIWIKSRLPRYQRRARAPDPLKKHLIVEKLQKILDRKYVVAPCTVDFISSLMDFFAVDKDSDIRLVYNGTSCGLNDALWAPNFWLPTPATAARTLSYGYYMVDIDLGEMFLNFPLHRVLQRFSGVDVSPYAGDLKAPDGPVGSPLESNRAHWTRCWMGLKPSPYMAVRFYYLAEEFARGHRQERTNPLRWDYIRLNLPGDPAYDPTLPRVMKWDKSIENIAGDLVAFIDDLRASGHSVERTWAIARQIVSRLQYLGLQDAPRKRRPPVRTPGAWAGSVFITTDSKVLQTVAQSKWDKAKSQISELCGMLESSPDGLLNYKRLEQIRGFLGHISMTYLVVTPYLKGLHLTLASHHPGRDERGWKMAPREWAAYLHEAAESGKVTLEQADCMARAAAEPIDQDQQESQAGHSSLRERKPLPPPPQTIKAAPRLRDDVRALGVLFDAEAPTQVLLRAAKVYTIIYGFADASGSGFGSTVLLGGGIHYRIGTWGSDSEDDSSNFREFENVVDTLREEAKAGSLKDALIILCTDNSTVESALVKGNSSSKKLFDLTLEVRRLEMREGASILVSHVSGERMKAQGTDGVSRAN